MATKITDTLITKKVTERTRYFDEQCSGFYVSILPTGAATFGFKFFHSVQKKRVYLTIGTFHPEKLNTVKARKRAFDLKGKGDAALEAKQQEEATGITVAELIIEFIDYIKVKVVKPNLTEKVARVESWKNYEDILNRFALPRLGDMVVTAVTKKDIGKLLLDVQAGKARRGYTASTANARNLRTALQAMFNYATEAGREHVPFSPCMNLPELDPEKVRERVLTADEIRTLWWGLDDPDLPCAREIALGLKLELVTMLRTKEFLKGLPGELKGLGTDTARFDIPAERVKKRKPLICPLTDLAQEVLAEAVTDPKQKHILMGKFDGMPLGDRALTQAVSGKVCSKTGKVLRPGIIHHLKMTKWTPHDLRRTSATLARNMGIAKWKVSMCLDHAVEEGEQAVPQITGVYVHSKFVGEKVEALEAVEKALREIIGKRPRNLRLVA